LPAGPPDKLRKFYAYLKENHIALAIGIGMLTWSSGGRSQPISAGVHPGRGQGELLGAVGRVVSPYKGPHMTDLKTSFVQTGALIRMSAVANAAGAIGAGAALYFLRDNAQIFYWRDHFRHLHPGLLTFIGAFYFHGMAKVDADRVDASHKTPEASARQVKKNSDISLRFAGASVLCFLIGLVCTAVALARL